jgi:transcriptional regulator with XRE-family HTH domain
VALASDKNQRFYRQLGNAIRTAREGRKLTQEQVALSVGLKRTSLTNIERGRQKLLAHTLADIAHTLGVSAAELLPNKSDAIEQLPVELPTNMPEKQREFIERVLTPGGTQNATTTDKANSRKGATAISGMRNNKSASGR